MNFADYVIDITRYVMYACWIVLMIYAGRVMLFILWTSGQARRMREAMAVGYTAAATYFTFYATKAMLNFVQRVVGDGSSIGTTTSGMYAALVGCSLVIFVAFICNFSRSLWMLKSLDHAVFEPVPKWKQLSRPMCKRLFEFSTRIAAAVLFIMFELQLENVADPHALKDVHLATERSISTQSLSQAGGIAVFLYLVLLLWWLSGLWIARSEMPKSLLLFFFCGLVNSIFIYVFGDEAASESRNKWLVGVVGLMTLFAGYMIYYVLCDLFKLLKNCFKLIRSKRSISEEVKAGA